MMRAASATGVVHTTEPSSVLPADSSSTRSSETLYDNDAVKIQPASGKARKHLKLPHSHHSPKNRNGHHEKEAAAAAAVVERSASTKRSKTFWTSFKYLCTLTEKQVDDFMASYVIYNLDWANESEMVQALGPDYKQKVGDCLRAYYGVINHLCALGDVEKMYIPPLMDKHVSVLDNQLLYEESVARDIDLKPGDRVLDIGCGRGRVAAHMAKFSGAKVDGINIDPNQVAQARAFNEEQGLQNTFIEWDQNNLPLPFEDATFDAFYEIQAYSLCKDIPAMFREVYRVLKPGAKFSMLDWVSLPLYDPTDPEQAELMRRVKPLIGAVGTPTPAGLEKALTDAGFQVTRSDNASVGGLQAPLIDKVDIYFRAMRQLILGLVRMRVLPKHFKTLINRLCLDGQAFVKMDKMRLITTSYRILAVKPKN
ncbi:S-adenosyl-methionine-sterol-C-methyltransferase [Niveomyces insectorum RCEF 264]|uniref:S-adenosyl-methionine-sterol-C-methyltransferase n=1 Tax=Niveomyces insectorum RCEF 264 TaxID=1081102 RepID=A0A162J4G1_9HYPO|nr:S-adenosyl-methionine-sterol-C-methyltransferase [Niveomyces insectorum RCEF 264]